MIQPNQLCNLGINCHSGNDCRVCKMRNEKMKKDSAATWKEIEEKTKSEHWMASGEAGGH
jgi:hypothetical protein